MAVEQHGHCPACGAVVGLGLQQPGGDVTNDPQRRYWRGWVKGFGDGHRAGVVAGRRSSQLQAGPAVTREDILGGKLDEALRVASYYLRNMLEESPSLKATFDDAARIVLADAVYPLPQPGEQPGGKAGE